jgi:hypothetical protein
MSLNVRMASTPTPGLDVTDPTYPLSESHVYFFLYYSFKRDDIRGIGSLELVISGLNNSPAFKS